MRAVPSFALGSIEVTPLELVTAYAPFANGGSRVTPRLVRRIERMDGTLLWSSEPVLTPAMDPRDAFQMTSMLRGVVDGGTGHVVRDMGVDGPDRRQDRHDERRRRHVVRRLHAGAGRGLLVRLRHTAFAW